MAQVVCGLRLESEMARSPSRSTKAVAEESVHSAFPSAAAAFGKVATSIFWRTVLTETLRRPAAGGPVQ